MIPTKQQREAWRQAAQYGVLFGRAAPAGDGIVLGLLDLLDETEKQRDRLKGTLEGVSNALEEAGYPDSADTVRDYLEKAIGYV